MAARSRSSNIARVVGPLALVTTALAIGAPAHASGPKATATAAKPKPKARATTTKKSTVAPKPKARATAAKPRVIVLKKPTGVTKAPDLDDELSFIPGSTALPFADMPVPVHAVPQGETPDSFPITPWQLETSHGTASISGSIITHGNSWGFRLPSSTGIFAIYPNASWMAGHDLTMECWGEFPSGKILVRAGGRDESGQPTLFASAELSPPAGGRGRFKVTIPTKGMTPLGAFQVRVTDADHIGKWLKLHECVMSRD